MTNRNKDNFRYQVGGTMNPDDLSYVEREADQMIYQVLRNNQYAYVFNSRQMGKSSLVRRVKHKLEQEGWMTVEMSSSEIGVNNVSESQWYCQFLQIIKEKLKLNFDVYEWWNPEPKGTLIGQFEEFMTKILWSSLPSEDQGKNILIIIDEIDGFLSLEFSTDDFFALIREFYNKDKQDNPELNRLIFCFLGVADHQDLMTDPRRTPFNNAIQIELKGFTLQEAKQGKREEVPEGSVKEPKQGLLKGLIGKVEEPERILEKVINYTEGQPYLTQFLCDKIFWGNDRNPDIKQLVTTNFINNWTNNNHFREIENRILKNDKYTAKLLEIYQRIREEEKILANDIPDKERMQLRLSGLVVETQEEGQAYLKIYNPIYREIFDDIWLNSQLERLQLPWYKWKKTAWEKTGDKFYLLYDGELEIALDHRYRILSDEDEYFIKESEVRYAVDKYDIKRFDNDRTKKKIINDRTKKKIIDRLIYWTNRQYNLLKALQNVVNNASRDNEEKIDEQWIDDLVKNSLIDNELKDDNLTAIIDDIKQRIEEIGQKSEDQLFDLLVTYGKIWLSSQSQSEESKKRFKYVEGDREQELLLSSDIGLVSKRWNRDFSGYYLEVSNPIYEKIFNLKKNDFNEESYVEQILPNIRGYGKKLAKWIIFQQNQYLLQKQELQDILKGLANQNLHEEEHQFLARSQVLNQRVA